MKKIIAFLLVCVMALSITACSGGESNGDSKYESDTMKLFIPGEYMAENLVTDFEKKFGVHVIVEYFDSNEMMYTKIAAGDKYDVLVPSDYMIERLMKEDQLQELDKSLIPNAGNIAEQVRGLDYDPMCLYSLPYFWGNVGIVYNKNNVPFEDIKAQGFDILKNPAYKGRVYMYDSERDGFMIAFKQLGYSCNTDNDAEIEAAYNWLTELNAATAPVYITDEVLDYMMSGSKDLAIAYSGDAVSILAENEDMRYFTPDCGTNKWCDAMCIPKNAENPTLAHEFINFVLSDEISRDNTLAVGYTSANANILHEMISEGGEYEGNEAYYPRTYDKDEVFRDNEALRQKLSELWIKVKAAK